MLAAVLRSRALVFGILLVASAAADLPPQEWERLRAEAAKLREKPGERDRKKALVQAVRQEDTVRAARLLVSFAASSAGLRSDLVARASNASDDFFKIDRELRKKHGRNLKREMLESDATWKKRREAFQQLTADRDAEIAVLEALGETLATFRSPDAVAALADASDPDVAAARRAAEIRVGILAALLAQPGDRFDPAIVALATEGDMPHVRVRVLDRIAGRKPAGGFEAATACLGATEPVVVRAAVAALKALDDRRAVPSLVQARQRAKGLLAEEIDLLLHRFTGKSFAGVGADAMWAGWWKSEGDGWLAGAATQRFEGGVGGTGGSDFYGIATRSNRIVFVFDRSYSMRLPVPQKGPVTGKRDEGLQGKTKFEVARSQLERSIRGLQPDVKFGVVFYGAKVQDWQEPPQLAAATAENKQRAIAWFSNFDPEGSTPIFEALHEALRYAKVGGGKSATDPAGADTLFLLSDGAPTRPGTEELLLGAELEAAIKAFLDANREFRCVVHTIGVGPDHNRDLMARLARETGGTYRAVSVD
jgi:CTP:molybdopterin cytidylyltransferase MocA